MMRFIKSLALSILLSAGAQAFAQDWLTDLQNERNDREEVNIKLPLKQLWAVHDIGHSPVYMNGKLYTLQGRHGFFTDKLYVHEIDQATGKIISKNLAGKVKNYKYIRMLGYQGKLYISTVWCYEPSVDKSQIFLNIFAYNPVMKKTEWQWASKPVGARDIGDMDQVGAWLTASENKIVLASMEVWQDKKIYCLNAATGHELWSSSAPKGNINSTYLPIAEGKVFVHTFNGMKNEGGHLAALDLSTGKVLWDREFKEVDQEKLKKYKVTDYRVWQAETDSSTVYKDGKVYVALYLFPGGGRVTAIEASTGKESWVKPIINNRIDGSPLIDKKYIYLVGQEKNITKAESFTGKIVWRKDTVESFLHLQSPSWLCYSQMAPLAKTLEFVSKTDGKPLASYDIRNITNKRLLDYVSSVIAMDNRILVENEDQTYYLFEEAE